MISMVIAGEYTGWQVQAGFKGVYLKKGFTKIKMDKENVEAYELITDEHRKSAASGIARGIVGGILLGPVGMLGGALSAKNVSEYQVAIQFKDGNKSLLKLDKTTYQRLMQDLF